MNLSNSAGQILDQNLSFHFVFFVAKKLGFLNNVPLWVRGIITLLYLWVKVAVNARLDAHSQSGK